MFLDVIDNLVEKGVNILSKLAVDWIDDIGKEVLGTSNSSSKSSNNSVVTQPQATIVQPAVGTQQPVNQVNVNVTVNGLMPGLIFIDENGNDIIPIDGYRSINVNKQF